MNIHEADQTHKQKQEEEEDCRTMGNPELPTHLVIDILSRLPVKTLLDFRRVCKEWLSLMSDPYFANLHRSKSHLSLLLKPSFGASPRSWPLNLVDIHVNPSTPPSHDPLELVTTTIKLPNGPNIPYNVINSCNGLLCLSDPCSNRPMCIYNPLLGELVTLPKCPRGCPISSASHAAFGFSPMTDQYKVVLSFQSRVNEGWAYEAEVYTLGEGSWRSKGKIPTMVDNASFNAFLNGSLHWISHALGVDFIYCFDFGSEQFWGVPRPYELGLVHRGCSAYMRVGVLRSCLSICDFRRGGVCEIWVMKDYGVKESWSKDFVIDNSLVDRRHLFYYEPIMVLEDGQILVFENCSYYILLYDPGLNFLRRVYTFGFDIGTYYLGLAHVPSLLSLRNVARGENFKKLNCSKETGSSC